jgi:hypothetical protein
MKINADTLKRQVVYFLAGGRNQRMIVFTTQIEETLFASQT